MFSPFHPSRVSRLLAQFALITILSTLCGCQTTESSQSTPAKIKAGPPGAKPPRLFTAILAGPLPAVIFESGLGETWDSWREVAPHTAPFALSCAYDRAGLGKSEKGALPRDGRQIAVELHDTLHAAQIAPPYILVAHSAGALYSRVFAGLFPNEVAGLVWVEPATVDFFDALKTNYPTEYNVFLMRKDAKKLPTGAPVPEGVRNEAAAWDATIEEARGSILPKVPMTVITAEESWPQQAGLWWQAHEDALKQSSDPRHVLAKKTGHYVQLNQPELVVQCILEVISESKTSPH